MLLNLEPYHITSQPKWKASFICCILYTIQRLGTRIEIHIDDKLIRVDTRVLSPGEAGCVAEEREQVGWKAVCGTYDHITASKKKIPTWWIWDIDALQTCLLLHLDPLLRNMPPLTKPGSWHSVHSHIRWNPRRFHLQELWHQVLMPETLLSLQVLQLEHSTDRMRTRMERMLQHSQLKRFLAINDFELLRGCSSRKAAISSEAFEAYGNCGPHLSRLTLSVQSLSIKFRSIESLGMCWGK